MGRFIDPAGPFESRFLGARVRIGVHNVVPLHLGKKHLKPLPNAQKVHENRSLTAGNAFRNLSHSFSFLRTVSPTRDTPPQTAERAVEIVRKILDDHEGMHEDFPPRVYRNEFNRDSLNIRFMYWFRPTEYWDFMAFSEKVNLRIKTEFEAEGIRFALPALKVVGDGKVPPPPA